MTSPFNRRTAGPSTDQRARRIRISTRGHDVEILDRFLVARIDYLTLTNARHAPSHNHRTRNKSPQAKRDTRCYDLISKIKETKTSGRAGSTRAGPSITATRCVRLHGAWSGDLSTVDRICEMECVSLRCPTSPLTRTRLISTVFDRRGRVIETRSWAPLSRLS